MGNRLEHYVVTVSLRGGYIHGYVMTNDESVMTRVSGLLIDEAEKLGFTCWPPIVLLTRLDREGWKIVRKIINRYSDEPKKYWRDVKDFHLTAWVQPQEHADAKELMDLH